MKLSYSEQLRHPRWQRKRLEVLEAVEFACEWCTDTERTLNVHHKRYVRGRLAWEYERWELEALCEDCHERAHAERARLDIVLALIPAHSLVRVIGILSGFVGFMKAPRTVQREISPSVMTIDVAAGIAARKATEP